MNPFIAEIKKKIRTRENGPAVETMEKLGIIYKINHGLSIEEIKAIAQTYLNRHTLALELWGYNNREFKILATLIEDPQRVDLEQLIEWGTDLKNSELAEQLAINLAFHSKYAETILDYWYHIDNEFTKKAAMVLLSWSAQRKADLEDAFFEHHLQILPTLIGHQLQLAKGISFAFRAIGKRNQYLNTKAIEILKSLKGTEHYNTKFIVDEALWELESDIVKHKLN